MATVELGGEVPVGLIHSRPQMRWQVGAGQIHLSSKQVRFDAVMAATDQRITSTAFARGSSADVFVPESGREMQMP